jgi:hypothetical protein
LFLAAFFWTGLTLHAAARIPNQLNDREFWQMISEYSEDGGTYPEENLTSNEIYFQNVIPDLQERTKSGGVYLGVGPEQNFTYVAAMKPKIAFIVDIRRGNMLEHLMYKALIETSADRADFLSKLFSRPRPAGLDSNSTAPQLFAAYDNVASDSALYRKNFAALRRQLTEGHGFALDDSDSNGIAYVYGAFFEDGPRLTYNYPNGNYGGGFGRGMPTYATLQQATDSLGKNWAFLASEANFRWLKDFESKNLLVPVVGDFGGPKAIRAVGQYLKDHHAVVSAIYTSNVEQYLFQSDGAWSRYYKNVETLPLDSTSTFIRSIGGFRGYYSPTGASARYGGRLASVTSSIQTLLKAFDAGTIMPYADVIAMSR